MPRRGSPYGSGHQLDRQALLGEGVVCHVCGAVATELDHVPPLALHARPHARGSGCCVLRPSCGPCARRQGGQVLAALMTGALPAALSEVDPEEGVVTLDRDDPAWDRCGWLDELRRDMPESATWPRFMSGPHPAAVGSYGPAAVAWLTESAGMRLRWWQQLAIYRQLEFDADGLLVWLNVLSTTARQSGKSTKLRAGAMWRLHQAELFGEEQTLLHTGKDLPICKEVQRLARVWAKERGYGVREQNGNEQITEPASGSRWIVRGKGSVYGYPGSYVMVDEAWGVLVEVIEDGLEPTMAERISPQMELTSTAHGKATSLFPARRAIALAELNDPVSTLLIEWSAPGKASIDDREAWRQASPHWSKGRERLLESRLGRVLAGVSIDPDEDDPMESFRAQYLNVWPWRSVSHRGEVLLDVEQWASQSPPAGSSPGEMWAAVEDDYGQGGAVAVVAALGGGEFEVDGRLYENRDAALDAARMMVESWPGPATLLTSPAIKVDDGKKMSSADTRFGLADIRALVEQGRLVHDHTPDLDRQLAAVRVRKVPTGGLALVGGERADLVRATSWALRTALAGLTAAVW